MAAGVLNHRGLIDRLLTQSSFEGVECPYPELEQLFTHKRVPNRAHEKLPVRDITGVRVFRYLYNLPLGQCVHILSQLGVRCALNDHEVAVFPKRLSSSQPPSSTTGPTDPIESRQSLADQLYDMLQLERPALFQHTRVDWKGGQRNELTVFYQYTLNE